MTFRDRGHRFWGRAPGMRGAAPGEFNDSMRWGIATTAHQAAEPPGKLIGLVYLSHRDDDRAHQSVSQLQALPLFAFYPQSNREQRLRLGHLINLGNRLTVTP
jgi:hypothetical protein